MDVVSLHISLSILLIIPLILLFSVLLLFLLHLILCLFWLLSFMIEISHKYLVIFGCLFQFNEDFINPIYVYCEYVHG